MFDFLIAKLRWVPSQVNHITGSTPSAVPRVFYSDSLISLEDASALRSGVISLTNSIPASRKDWHPESNDLVLDLVHPSLYPYVQGRTRRFLKTFTASAEEDQNRSTLDVLACKVLRALGSPFAKGEDVHSPIDALSLIGQGTAVPPAKGPLWITAPPRIQQQISMENLYRADRGELLLTEHMPSYPDESGPVPDLVEMIWPSSSRYLWLPTDIKVSPGPGSSYTSQFLSYVNNLHPDPSLPSGQLYPIIENIFSRFVPLFEQVINVSEFSDTRKEFLAENGVYWDPPSANEMYVIEYLFVEIILKDCLLNYILLAFCDPGLHLWMKKAMR